MVIEESLNGMKMTSNIMIIRVLQEVGWSVDVSTSCVEISIDVIILYHPNKI